MIKRSLIFTGPVTTASGYGTHARQVLRAIVDSGEYEVFVEPIRWGETSHIHDDAEVGWIRPLIEARQAAGDRRYDVSVQVTIPNEFRRRARLNVGVTAGIEVDRVSPSWLVKVNEEVDLLVVPSEHSRRAFTDTRYADQQGNVLALGRPIAVVPESVPDLFLGTHARAGSPLPDDLPPANLLVVGLGMDKPLGEDRKNISHTVLWFLQEFRGRRDVGLVLKTSIVNCSLADAEMVRRRVSELRQLADAPQFPRVTLVHGRLDEHGMHALYTDRRVTALVSLTHGEGFGLPIIEAAACGLPVIATGWSGHLDFLTVDGGDAFLRVEHDLKEIPASCVWEGVMERGSQWAVPREEDAKACMRQMLGWLPGENDRLLTQVELLRERIATEFSQDKLRERLTALLNEAWSHTVNTRPEGREEAVAAIRAQLRRPAGRETLIYTMPMSGGDVYLSTAVLRSLCEKHARPIKGRPLEKTPDGKRWIDTERPYVYFATQGKYRSILEGNPDIDEVIEWQPWMQDVSLLEDVFDHVYTPNLAIQMNWSNWVHRGRGRNLLHELAAQCDVPVQDLGGPTISTVPVEGLPESYLVIHTGSGKGQWGARRYNRWQDVADNLQACVDHFAETRGETEEIEYINGASHTAHRPRYPGFRGIKIVQVGLPDEPQIRGAIDLRGKTPDYRQLAAVIKGARCVVSIDSLSMHLAAHHGVPHVALFGGSYARSTGTAYGGAEAIPGGRHFMPEAVPRTLIETTDRFHCERACYKNECQVDAESPCINNIGPVDVVVATVATIARDLGLVEEEHGLATKAREMFRARVPSISGYTHTYNALTHGYPFVESIRSMLGFCSEVIVVDGGSTDGTLEAIAGIGDPRIKVITNPWDPEEPGMDGMQKAFGRVMCDPAAEFLWQQDCDEVVHEDDYERVYEVARRFPADVQVMHLPVIELWGDTQTVRTDRHAWKWRLSRNDYNITHGINRAARLIDQKTGRMYARKGMSDGCEYIDVSTGEYLPHKGFWRNELHEERRQRDPIEYGRRMNHEFDTLPCVFHYSWADLPRKVRNFRDFWDRQWGVLHQEPAQPRFPEVVTDEDVKRAADELRARGGEHGPAPTFRLERTNPVVMADWIKEAGI